MKLNLPLPLIPEEQKSPLILQLIDFIERQASIIQQQTEQIQQLKDEIARLKNQPPRPKIKPSRLGNKAGGKMKRRGKKRPGSNKRNKTAHLKIHETIPIPPENIPPMRK